MERILITNLPKEAINYNHKEMVNWLLDNGYDTIINNVPPPPHMEYDLSDLEVVWHNIAKVILRINNPK